MNEKELNEWLCTLANEVKQTKSDYSRNVVRGCPIPFFGNILSARVLTVGVNPSDMEKVLMHLFHLMISASLAFGK
jgi:hypothetical protein